MRRYTRDETDPGDFTEQGQHQGGDRRVLRLHGCGRTDRVQGGLETQREYLTRILKHNPIAQCHKPNS